MEFENLIKLINTVSASELTGFKYEEKGLKLQMSKGDGEVKVVAAPAAPLPAAPLPLLRRRQKRPQSRAR